MPSPGWYEDPSGVPGQVRWWDGRAWTGQVRAATPTSIRRGAPAWPWLATLAVVLVLGLGVWLVLRPGGRPPQPLPYPATPSVTGWDERTPTVTPPSPTPPTPPPSVPQPTAIPCPALPTGRAPHPSDGRLHGGGLVVDVPAGFSPTGARFLTWAQDEAAATKPAGGTWLSFTGVAKVSSSHFHTPKDAASQLRQCHTSSGQFPGMTGEDQLASEAVNVAGHPGWWVRSNVTSTSAPGGGARFDYVVVDLGTPGEFGVYWAGVTFNDAPAMAAVDVSRASLTAGR